MHSLLVFDGAMGSLLYERGIFVTQNFEQLNVTRSDVVKKIHEDYVAAGAQVIETNTFGANSFRLDRHGLGDQVRAYNLAGAQLARAAAGEDVWVGGSVGPTGLVPGVATKTELDLAFASFAEASFSGAFSSAISSSPHRRTRFISRRSTATPTSATMSGGSSHLPLRFCAC